MECMWEGHTDCLSETTKAQGDQVCPCLISYAEDELDTQAEGEEGTEEGIGAKIGVVAVDGEVDGAVDTDRGAVLYRLFGCWENGRLRWVRHDCSSGEERRDEGG